MQSDFEGRVWADNHQAASDTLGGAIDKLGYLVGAVIARRRAGERRARWDAQFH